MHRTRTCSTVGWLSDQIGLGEHFGASLQGAMDRAALGDQVEPFDLLLGEGAL